MINLKIFKEFSPLKSTSAWLGEQCAFAPNNLVVPEYLSTRPDLAKLGYCLRACVNNGDSTLLRSGMQLA